MGPPTLQGMRAPPPLQRPHAWGRGCCWVLAPKRKEKEKCSEHPAVVGKAAEAWLHPAWNQKRA